MTRCQAGRSSVSSDSLHPSARAPSSDHPASTPLLRLAEHLQAAYGLRADPASIRRLRSAAIERARVLHATSLDAYAEYAAANARELERLIERYLVGETAFFRTPAHFEQLRRRVLPELDAMLPADTPLQLWCAGCSTGEEAYSLAIVCAETLGQRRRFQVLGTDLNAAALAVARAGRYPPRAVARVPSTVAARYFTREGASYRVVSDLAQHLRFEQANLVSATPLPQLATPIHLITCENVLIYFTAEAAARALAAMIAVLAPGGYLLLGSSERLPADQDALDPVWLGEAVAWRKRVALPSRGREQTATALGGSSSERPAALAAARERLAAARRCADQDELERALELAREAVELAPLWDQAHALVATVQSARGQIREALAASERARYLAPGDPLIAFQHATLLREAGRPGRARREFAELARRLAQLPGDQPVGEFSAALLLRLCREQAGPDATA